MCTSPCASHWHLPTTPQVQCILLTSSCSWRTCPRSQRHLSFIPGSLFYHLLQHACLIFLASRHSCRWWMWHLMLARIQSHQNGWLSISTKPNVWPEHISHPIWQVMRRGKIWLMPLTTASMAHLCPNVIMLALMQCILNLIVHNLPSLKASLKVRRNLWQWRHVYFTLCLSLTSSNHTASAVHPPH